MCYTLPYLAEEKATDMHLRQAILQIDQQTYALTPNRTNSFDEIFVDFRQEPPEQGGGVRYHIFLHPKQDVTVRRLELQFEIPTQPDDRFFANGYQSWSESRLLRVTDQLPRLRRLAHSVMGYSGDEHIADIPHGDGHLHSWTYTYLQRASGKSSLFCGSLHEKTGFTLLLYDQRNGLLTVRKDLSDLRLSHSFPALDIWMDEGEEQELFDRYFQAMELPVPIAPPALGWTSGDRHLTNISAEILSKDLDSLINTPITTAPSPAYFQVEDGWQTAVGDWLSVKPGFPGGMARMTTDIRAKGLLPGLWLAPFVAAKDSDLVKKHPDWLLKDGRGRSLRVGKNPKWGGWYYALDFYNGAVRDYLSGVFHIITEKWGYELVKLDYLFAVCLAPPPGKTRGAVMYEAMEFLRQQVGTRRILASGVPLGSCFGLVDYGQVGSEMNLVWDNRLFAFLRHRERTGALPGLHSTLGRWGLNGRAFHSEPGLVVLREKAQKLTLPQQQTLLIINVLLGNLHFAADDLSQYSPEQTAELEGALMWRGSRILSVRELETEVYAIYFEQEKEQYIAYCNLTTKQQFLTADHKNGRIEIQPFETIILLVAR